MKESDFLSAENDPELKRLLSIYNEIQQTGKTTYLEDYELSELATYYYNIDDDENLEQITMLAEQLHPDSIETMYIKTRFLIKQYRWEEAYACIEQLKEYAELLHEDDNSYTTNELQTQIHLLEGEAALLQKRPEEADACFHKAFNTAQDKEDKSYVAIHAASMLLIHNTDERAIKWVERSIELVPGNQPALELLSYYYNSRKEIRKAEKVLNQLVDEDPYSTHYWKLTGDTYLNNGEFEKAIDAYDFALAIDVNDYEALKKKAVAFIHLENYEKALLLLDNYQKRIPDDFNAYVLSTICLTNIGQFSEASELMEKVMEESDLGRNDQTVNQIELFHLIIRTYRMGREFDKAIEWIDKAIEQGLDRPTLHIMKGGIYMEKRMKKEALKYFCTAIAESEDQTAALYLIANELFFYGNYETCEHILSHVYKEAEKSEFPSIPAMLAYCYLQQEQYDKYLQYLEISCQEAPEEATIIFLDYIPEEASIEEFYESEKRKYT